MKTLGISALTLGAVALMLALSDTPAQAAGSAGSPHQFCHWFKQQAMNTGDEYWWWRWRRCIRGNYWD
jgi:hypothetical protein